MISSACKTQIKRQKKTGSLIKKIKLHRHSTKTVFSTKGAEKIVKNSNIWNELSEKYDVCNASFEQLCELSCTLFRAGEISLIEHAIITFYPVNSIQRSEYNSPDSSSSGINWISVFKARLTKELVSGNTAGYRNTGTIIKIIEQLKRKS
ncbi:MAG: hypothetical protein GX640_12290 [Fibrobacter sp.]|nr:hypothetical protein [Fibrobacter sp.]